VHPRIELGKSFHDTFVGEQPATMSVEFLYDSEKRHELR
jgi:hypothetical protein